MTNENEVKSFNSKEDAENLLKESRNRIDEIDNELFDLICQRTSIAKDVALAKDYLGLPIYDKSREDAIHAKVEKLSEENDIDTDIVNIVRKFRDAFKSVTAQREIKQKLRSILWIKYGLKDQDVFDRAYKYIEMYY